MAKKRVSKTRKTLKQIYNIPKCSHQRRSSPPKRRTDFSSFFCCNSFSLSNSGSLLGSSCAKVLSNDTSTGLQERNGEGTEVLHSSLVRCSKSEDEGFFSNSTDASVLEVELVDQNALMDSRDYREVGKDSSDVLGTLDYSSKKSHVAETKVLLVSPTSVACMEAHKMRGSAEDLQQREHAVLSSEELVKGTAASNHSDELDLSSDKSALSVSSRTEYDILEKGRGKRERKPKLHFDDITFSLKPERKVRRFRIMRYLGLTPPVGSPF
ncbi:hypothetical protein PanWU01x14_336130 [Parasponia andersonii]|uniref:Uncharacterized protein n=1 Tax=Parasponia andersonii TaxID=3476 RepID=A0A2P5AFZ6_PARAD|nr:hypothetical protein PanWU01x14_336130 [Parasponia andersonii]